MAFLLSCPNCGERNIYEFRYGGEVQRRPAPDASNQEWAGYFYSRTNIAGWERAWWYHKFGCRKWFIGVRDTVTNEVFGTSWPEEAHS